MEAIIVPIFYPLVIIFLFLWVFSYVMKAFEIVVDMVMEIFNGR